jgi:hypothetical protein
LDSNECGVTVTKAVNGAECDSWCNPYTCYSWPSMHPIHHCTGCAVCTAQASHSFCNSWCNTVTNSYIKSYFTTQCGGCTTSSGDYYDV